MKKLLIPLFILTMADIAIAGAWGYGPRDNDAALDLFQGFKESSNILNDISVILETYGEGYESEVRGACDYLINELSSKLQSPKQINQCITIISDYYNDPDYLEAWDDETNIKDALNKQIQDLKSFKDSAHNKFIKVRPR